MLLIFCKFVIRLTKLTTNEKNFCKIPYFANPYTC